MSTSKPPSGSNTGTDKDVQSLLLRLRCPTPLHVLRTLFLGHIASPRMDVSPMAPVAQCRRRSKSEPPRRPNIEPGVEADFKVVSCG